MCAKRPPPTVILCLCAISQQPTHPQPLSANRDGDFPLSYFFNGEVVCREARRGF